MTTQENRAVITRFYEELFNGRDRAVTAQLLGENLVYHGPFGEIEGLVDFGNYLETLTTAFPDLHLHLEEDIAEGDRIAVRWAMHGHHEGEFLGIEPTQQEFSIEGIDFIQLHEGRIQELWSSFDTFDMLQQLGVISPESSEDDDFDEDDDDVHDHNHGPGR